MGGSARLQVLHTHPPERTPSYTCTININTHSQLHKLLSLSPLTSQNPMYTSTTKLSHRQTHSTRPSTLCSDQSHRKGFSPLIHLHTHLRDCLFICFRMPSFSRSVRFQPQRRSPQREFREFPSSLWCCQSVRQPVTQNQRVYREEVLTAAEVRSLSSKSARQCAHI